MLHYKIIHHLLNILIVCFLNAQASWGADSFSNTIMTVNNNQNEFYRYVYRHSIGMRLSAKECRAYQGDFSNNICFVPAQDTVLINKKKDEKFYHVEIFTTGAHAHMCQYQAHNGRYKKNRQGQRLLISSNEQCEVIIFFNQDRSISVRNNEKCDFLCGGGALLQIQRAIPVSTQN